MKKLTETEFRNRVERAFQSHTKANKLKDFLQKEGFSYTMSLYGIVTDKTTKHSEYKRIEVFINGAPDQTDVAAINHFFEEIYPPKYYSIFVYNRESKEIGYLDGWD